MGYFDYVTLSGSEGSLPCQEDFKREERYFAPLSMTLREDNYGFKFDA